MINTWGQKNKEGASGVAIGGEVAVLNRGRRRGDFTNRMKFKQRPEGNEVFPRGSQAGRYVGKSVPGGGKSQGKDPELGPGLADSKNNKE